MTSPKMNMIHCVEAWVSVPINIAAAPEILADRNLSDTLVMSKFATISMNYE